MLKEIIYRTDVIPSPDLIINLYVDAGLKRPLEDKDRINRMFVNSNLIITAWHNKILVGIARSMTDYGYWCYLADLAVRSNYQKQGIGNSLINETKIKAGKDCTLLLLSAPTALSYYKRIGLKNVNNAFILNRDNK
ncbi:GNAT family N-acetyltransferase [Pseudopedobacter sp.]|uniref:GNAT family N-acetyltransferase n=1 Tax=Pseudopedobacter sp. TaxID=1936787 RepID=UPI0033423BA1